MEWILILGFGILIWIAMGISLDIRKCESELRAIRTRLYEQPIQTGDPDAW